MVKNSTGGNKSKKQARKSTNISQQNKEIRKAVEVGEVYAAVTKMFGGKECEVMCIDGIKRRCVMRSKFTFRSKAENNLSPGTMVLVGLRDWEVRHTGNEKCDLLEVYSQSEKERLKQTEGCDFSAINSIITDPTNTKNDDVFSNYEEMDEGEISSSEDDVDASKSKSKVDTSMSKNKVDNSMSKNKVDASMSKIDASMSKIDAITNKTDIKSHNDWMIDENDI